MGVEEKRIVYLSQNSITGQTFHWHDELELLLVAEGSLNLKVGYEELLLKEGDIMLINSDEIHSMRETRERNIVVCIYIDCNFIYEKYPDFYEIVAIWPYSEAFEKLNQQKYTILRYITGIALALEEGETNEKIAGLLDSLLRSLIYCYRLDITNPDGAGFQVTDEKKDIIYRTIKYLYSNYKRKVNLQDVSEQEYMSMFYLSHSFKDITGYSFRDWLNFVRVEKAEKMLLVTTASITDIAHQCGFSDVRYFNKHFTKWYKISPNKYRKLFQESYDLHERMENFEENVSMGDIINRIETTIPLRKDEIIKGRIIKINLKSTPVLERLNPMWKEELWCSGFAFADPREMEKIEELQQYVRFSAITVDEIFSLEGGHADSNLTPRDIHTILNYLLDRFEKVYLVVNCSREDQYEIETAENTMDSFFKFYPRSGNNRIEFRLNLSDDDRETLGKINKFICTLGQLNIKHKRYFQYKKPLDRWGEYEMDYLMNMVEGDLRLDWLFSPNGFKNNLYYFYFFLSQMGEAVVAKEDSFVITRKEDGFQIFFHNKGARTKHLKDVNYKLAFNNITGNYKVIIYTWDMERNNYATVINNQKAIKYLSDYEHKIVDSASLPDIAINYIDENNLRDNSYEIDMPLPSTSMRLILLKKVS